MRRFSLAIHVLALTVLSVQIARAAQPSRRRAITPGGPTPNGVSVTLVSPPQPVAGNGAQQLAWELLFRNDRTEELTLTAIDILDGRDRSTLASYSTSALRALIFNIPPRPLIPNTPQDRVRAGEVAVIFFWASWSGLDEVPPFLLHRIRFTSAVGNEVIEGPLTSMCFDAPVVISAPMRGSSWLAANGPSNDSFHRRAITNYDGRWAIAQRFAVDWVQLDGRGSTYWGDWRMNASYYAYGADVLAVADGVISQTKDGIPENVPQQAPVVPITPDTIAGNHVILDLGDGRFALYAHLQPGSLRVNVGDRVTSGTPLGRLGNSGNSTEPHLHFHICDANDILACDGLAYVLDHFATIDGQKRLEMPMNGMIVDF